MYYIENNDKIVLFDKDRNKLSNTLIFMPQYQGLEIKETDKNIVTFENEFYFEDDETYIAKVTQSREEGFYKEFFETSLGWIRRKPILADGTLDDFLNNDLPLFAIALMSGQNPVLPIAYELPDFTNELTKEYMETLQIKDQAITQQFIGECLAIKSNDFKG